MLHRERKEGLGPAYLAGFRRALDEGAELVLEMDCDFSHDPADVPRLIAAAEDGADLALGSRYVPGGRIGNWGLIRRAISRGGSLYTAAWLRMGVEDPTGGFKCFRRAVLEALDLDAVTAKGYAFQIELTYRAKRRGFRVIEVPIVFDDRDGRALEDEPADHARGRVARAAAAAARLTSGRAHRHRRDLRRRGAAGRLTGGRRLLGALVRPVQGDRAGAGGARRGFRRRSSS